MKDVIATIEKDFQTEISAKQEAVASTLNQLREITVKLGKERDKMNDLRQRSRDHGELRQHCINLRRAIDEEKARFSATTAAATTTNGDAAAQRDADAPFALKTSLLAPVNAVENLTPQQLEYVKSLPSAAVLKARLQAYKTNEEALREKATKLHDQSAELEEKFRRVVALCTNVTEDKIDSLLGGLVQAVESDPGEVDTARVSSFLRKVDESAGGGGGGGE
jgi:regulatory protein SWI6